MQKLTFFYGISIIAISLLCSTNLRAQTHETLIRNYIYENKSKEFKKSNLTDFNINMVDNSGSLKGTVVKFQQMYNGIPVNGCSGTVLIKNNKVIYYTDNFVKDFTTASSNFAAISEETALQKIADELGNPEIKNRTITDTAIKEKTVEELAIQKIVYVIDNGNLKLAYKFIISEPGLSNLWDIIVDANTGNIINKENRIISCQFENDAYHHDHSHEDHIDSQNKFSETVSIGPFNQKEEQSSFLLAPDNASYNVFALPIEAPSFGERTMVTNPWLLEASPEGWHSDGENHYTTTFGNNIDARYDDFDDDVEAFYPNGGEARNFDFPFNPELSPRDNLSAAVTNVFYSTNIAHDIFYLFGFTQTSRNLQNNNFGQGEEDTGNDALRVWVQQDSNINNAEYGPFPDGIPPVLQSFLWQDSKMLKYNTPENATTRNPSAGRTAGRFGPILSETGITGDIMLSPASDACNEIPAGTFNGKIALTERGDCEYTTQVKNVQNAGAVAAIIYNDAANGDNINLMYGIDAEITISSILITHEEGSFIKSQLEAGTNVNVTLKRGEITLDSTLDNGVMIHEYGHAVTTRLTGDGETCLSPIQSKEQMGEGWSDFFALMLTNQPGDNASVARGIGTYVLDEKPSSKGIRLTTYSPDFNVNDYTYGDTNGMEVQTQFGTITLVHNIGFIWGTMLWDLTWEYVAKYGYASNVVADMDSGSARIMQLVIDGVKLQACQPSFVDGRDAILAAEMATTGGEDRCMIWEVFAKRGLGVNASAGSLTDINDQVESFDIPADCILATDDVESRKGKIAVYPNPANNEFFIRFSKQIKERINIELYDMTGKLVYNEFGVDTNNTKSVSTKSLPNGIYVLKANGTGYSESIKIIIKK